MITSTQLFALAFITSFALGMKIIQAVTDHVKAKNAIKQIEAEKERREAAAKAAELAKLQAETEKLSAEVKLTLANRIAGMNGEQLAAYNRTLIAAQSPPRYVPVYLPAYPIYPIYDPMAQNQSLIGRW